MFPPLASSLTRLPDLVRREHAALKARDELGDHGPIAKFYRYRRMDFYEQPAPEGEISKKWLMDAKPKQTRHCYGIVPRWARVLTESVDVQQDRLYWFVIAHEGAPGGPFADPADNVGQRWFAVAGGVLDITEPKTQHSKAELHAGLDELHDMAAFGWPVEDMPDKRMRVSFAGVDMGKWPEHIAPWLRQHSQPKPTADGHMGPRWIGLRGAGKDDLGTKIDSSQKLAVPPDCAAWLVRYRAKGWRVQVVRIERKYVLRAVHSSLLINATPDPENPTAHLGAGILPADLKTAEKRPRGHLWWCSHLAGVVYNEETGKWDEYTPRHDMLDCAVYDYALGKIALHQGEMDETESGEASSGDVQEGVPGGSWADQY